MNCKLFRCSNINYKALSACKQHSFNRLSYMASNMRSVDPILTRIVRVCVICLAVVRELHQRVPSRLSRTVKYFPMLDNFQVIGNCCGHK